MQYDSETDTVYYSFKEHPELIARDKALASANFPLSKKKQRKREVKKLKRHIKYYNILLMLIITVVATFFVAVQTNKTLCAGYSQAEMDATRMSTFRTEPQSTLENNGR